MSFSAIADAANATGRLSEVFEAELLEEGHIVDENLDVAIEVKGASFSWDSPPPEEQLSKKKQAAMTKAKALEVQEKKQSAIDDKKKTEVEHDTAEGEHVFKIRDVTLSIPRGKLVAFVGPVGSGKSSLLQGIIGEMRKTSGSITFGGSVSYCPQSAWIQVRRIAICR
jgi:ABC-type glutathione transport system ATPase component